ncbi:MAG: fibronectin type III domain-containing protein [Chloroflexi bacterium]|nr:fibronectin type III domain-containing protein [Chloroflexota bacterium]
MSSRDAKTERQSPSRWSRAFAPAALVSASVLAVFLTAILFTTAVSRADGPPDLGGAFTLPFKLEQGRPAPVRASSVPRQAQTPTPPTPAATPGPTPEPVAPSTPPNVNAYPIAYNIIEIEWGKPEGEVDGFEVQVSADDGKTWRLLAGKSSLTDPAGRLYTWTQQSGLKVNQTRHYQVRAGNGDAWSEWSSSVSATTYSTSEPSLTVQALGKNDLKISWGMPSHHATVTGWRLEVSKDAPAQQFVSFLLPLGKPGGYLARQPAYDSKQSWTQLATLAAADRSYTHSGLAPGDTRYYRLRPVTDVGSTSWSQGTDHATTLTTSLPAAPTLTVQAKGKTEIVLTWTQPADRGFPITGYEWQESADGSDWTDLGSGSAEQTSATIDIRERGLARHYRVRARNAEGLGPWSPSASATPERVKPGDPEWPREVDAGTTWVEVAWDAAKKGDLPITGYQVQSAKENNSGERMGWKDVGSTGPSTLTFRHTGLQPGTFYFYRVAARDREGLGPWSWAPYGIRARTVGVPPAAPKITAKAGERDNGAHWSPAYRYTVWIELDWDEPERRNGGIRDFFYKVQWSPDGKNWRDEDPLYPVGNARGQDQEVGYGETRYYRVKANNRRNGADPSPWSNVASATTRVVVPSSPGISFGSTSENTIEVGWYPPDSDGGRDIASYEIQVSEDGHHETASWSKLVSPSAGSERVYVHSGLQPATKYCYRIRAKNSVGWSDWNHGFNFCARTTE